jgi:hypothetical protein
MHGDISPLTQESLVNVPPDAIDSLHASAESHTSLHCTPAIGRVAVIQHFATMIKGLYEVHLPSFSIYHHGDRLPKTVEPLQSGIYPEGDELTYLKPRQALPVLNRKAKERLVIVGANSTETAPYTENRVERLQRRGFTVFPRVLERIG